MTLLLESSVNGSSLAAPAASTPGSARTRWTARAANARSAASSAYARGWRVDPAGQDVGGSEAGIDGEETLETGKQEAGADEQDEREGDLGDDQRAACEA